MGKGIIHLFYCKIMTKHKIINILYFAGLVYLIYLDQSMGLNIWAYVFFFLSYILILFFGVVFTQLNFFVEHELGGDARFNEIAISFDDGPNAEFTEKVLDKLGHYHVKATFFLIGENIEKNPELLQRIHQEGHLIGNHSFHHRKNFEIQKTSLMNDEINRSNQLIEEIIHLKPRFFRPPFGLTNPRVAQAIKQTNMLPIAWSLRTYDTKNSVKSVIKKLRKSLNGGDLILLHDNHDGILEILDFLIPFAQESGFKIVNVDELIKQKAYV